MATKAIPTKRLNPPMEGSHHPIERGFPVVRVVVDE
jgi:hypothetical protein